MQRRFISWIRSPRSLVLVKVVPFRNYLRSFRGVPRRAVPILGAVVLLASGLSVLLPAAPALADTKSLCEARGGDWIPAATKVAAHCSISMVDGFTPSEEVASLANFETVGDCIEKQMKQSFTTTVNAGNASPPSEWFSTDYTAWAYPHTKSTCARVTSAAVSAWGIEATVLLKNMGYVFRANTDTGQPTYESASSASSRRTLFENYISTQVYGGSAPSRAGLSGAAKYARASTLFLLTGADSCRPDSLGKYPNGLKGGSTTRSYIDAGTVVTTQNINGDDGWLGSTDGEVTYTKIALAEGTGNSATTTLYGYRYLSETTESGAFQSPDSEATGILGWGLGLAGSGYYYVACADLVSQINANVGAMKAWLYTNPDKVDKYDQVACPDGTTVQAGEDCQEESGTSSSCNIPDLGWILCPALSVGARLADSAYGFLADSFLSIDVGLFNADPTATAEGGQRIGTGTYAAWRIMQSIGNIAFIVAFMIVVLSQLTGVGVSNYGVKKLMPRLIVSAVLVNLSFYICQVAIDASNILGYGLKSLLEGIADQVSRSGGTPASTTDDSANLAGIVTTIIAAGAVVWINVGAVTIAIVGALVTLLTIFVLLVARKALIVLLVVIAPLAFVAYLLPNTEPLFHKWRKALTALLLLFPIIGLLYGGSLLASAVMKQAAGTDTVLNIAAYVVLVIPLIAVIPLLKGALDGIGTFGATIQSVGQRLRGTAEKSTGTAFDRSRLGQFKKYRQGISDRRRAQIQGGTYRGRGGRLNPLNWASGVNRGLNRIGGQFGSEMAASGAQLVDEEAEREVKTATALITQQRLTSTELQELAEGREVQRAGRVIVRKPSDAMRHAAVREKLRTGTVGEVEQLLVGSATAPVRVRQELARGIHANGHVAKADYLGGDFADRVLLGHIRSSKDLDDAAARRLDAGKVSAETLVAQDADALDRFARVADDAIAGVRSDVTVRRLEELREHAVEAQTNPQLAGRVTGQKSAPISRMTRL